MLVAYTAYQESKEHEHWHRRGDTPQSVIQASPLWCEPSRPVKIVTETLCPLLEYGKGQVDGAAICKWRPRTVRGDVRKRVTPTSYIPPKWHIFSRFTRMRAHVPWYGGVLGSGNTANTIPEYMWHGLYHTMVLWG